MYATPYYPTIKYSKLDVINLRYSITNRRAPACSTCRVAAYPCFGGSKSAPSVEGEARVNIV